MIRRQQDLWDELNYWYAVECAIECGTMNYHYGLGYLMYSFTFNIDDFCEYRRTVQTFNRLQRRFDQHRPNRNWYCWPLGDWDSRLAFVRQMIALTEMRLAAV